MWSRAEAMFLLDVAQRAGSINVQTAIVALESADGRLAAVGTRQSPRCNRSRSCKPALGAATRRHRHLARLASAEEQAAKLRSKASSRPNAAPWIAQRCRRHACSCWAIVRNTLANLIIVHGGRPASNIVTIEEAQVRRQHFSCCCSRLAQRRTRRYCHRASLSGGAGLATT
jgi:hypothetical protein